MHATYQQRARRAVVAAAAVVAVPAAFPSGAFATHNCIESETYVALQPTNTSQPVDSGHRMPFFYACGPHEVRVSYVEQNGASNDLVFTQGDVAYTRREAEPDRVRTSSPSATPPQESRPARKAKRSCRKSRRAKSRARTRGERRAARRCRSGNRRRR